MARSVSTVRLNGGTREHSSSPLILIDFDDVLCQTNAAAVKWHNDTYGTNMTLGDFHYYHWWKNPGWGDPSETKMKADIFYSSLHFLQLGPLPDTVQALQSLKEMGYRLSVVTSRSKEHLEQTTAWIGNWMGEIFESIYFTGDPVTVTDSSGEERQRLLTKGEVCEQVSAYLLIDDAVENVLSCVSASSTGVPALLFGDYEWGRRTSLLATPEDFMSFDERRQHETALGKIPEWWKEDTVDLPEGIWRVKNWTEVLEWVRAFGNNV